MKSCRQQTLTAFSSHPQNTNIKVNNFFYLTMLYSETLAPHQQQLFMSVWSNYYRIHRSDKLNANCIADILWSEFLIYTYMSMIWDKQAFVLGCSRDSSFLIPKWPEPCSCLRFVSSSFGLLFNILPSNPYRHNTVLWVTKLSVQRTQTLIQKVTKRLWVS